MPLYYRAIALLLLLSHSSYNLHLYDICFLISGAGEPPAPPPQPLLPASSQIQRIALLNWKNGTKTLFWQEDQYRRGREEGAEAEGSGSSRHLLVVWCEGNTFTCKVPYGCSLRVPSQ